MLRTQQYAQGTVTCADAADVHWSCYLDVVALGLHLLLGGVEACDSLGWASGGLLLLLVLLVLLGGLRRLLVLGGRRLLVLGGGGDSTSLGCSSSRWCTLPPLQ
jgi:hypothetical protein